MRIIVLLAFRDTLRFPNMKTIFCLLISSWILASAHVQAAYPSRRIEVVPAGNAGGGLDEVQLQCIGHVGAALGPDRRRFVPQIVQARVVSTAPSDCCMMRVHSRSAP